MCLVSSLEGKQTAVAAQHLAIISLFSFAEPIRLTGEGATTTPGRFTLFFGRIKGRAESDLLKLSNDAAYPSLKVFSLRPAGVDPKFHSEIHQWIPKLPASKAIYGPPMLAAMRTLSPGFISPTKKLGRVLTELAMSEGEPLSGAGVTGEGRTVSNAGMRRLAGI